MADTDIAIFAIPTVFGHRVFLPRGTGRVGGEETAGKHPGASATDILPRQLLPAQTRGKHPND